MIYFIQCETTGLTKIGWTRALGGARRGGGVLERLRSFQTCSATRLRVVSVVDGNRSDEVRLHRENEDRRVRGEWFRDVDPPPSQYDIACFPSSLATAPLPTNQPSEMLRNCVECGARFKIKARTRSRARCSPCSGWRALAFAVIAASRPTAPTDPVAVERSRAGRARNAALEPEWRARAEASGCTWEMFCSRLANGKTPEEALGPKQKAGRRPGSRYTRDGVSTRAKRIGADIGLHWSSVYRVLRGLAPNHRRTQEILSHPGARSA